VPGKRSIEADQHGWGAQLKELKSPCRLQRAYFEQTNTKTIKLYDLPSHVLFGLWVVGCGLRIADFGF
jgi:hypothetical protein